MNASSITLPRLTIYASAIGTVVLLCVAPFALPRVSPPEMRTSIIKPALTAAPSPQPLLAGKRPKPSAAHRKTVHIPAPETVAVADTPATPLNE
jgi:hypothetical protein